MEDEIERMAAEAVELADSLSFFWDGFAERARALTQGTDVLFV